MTARAFIAQMLRTPSDISHPGFLSWTAHARQLTARRGIWGDGDTATVSLKTEQQGPCRGLGCRTAGLTIET